MPDTGRGPARPARPARQMVRPGDVSVVVWAVLLSLLAIIGSDLLWVVALGDVVRETGAVPVGVPFATAPQVDWHSPVVVAELLLSLVNSVGPWALTAFHLLLVAATLAVTVVEARRLGAGEPMVALVVSLVVIGCSTAFVVARLPSLSLVPFTLLVALLRRQDAGDGGARRLWWVVALLVMWGNLHGGVLVGVAVLGVHLVTSRGAGSVGRRLAVGGASLVALFATSAGLHTPAYYVGVLGNEAAAQHTDLWARPDLGSPLDVAMLACAAVLLMLFARRRPPTWEWIVAVGLAVGTVLGARNGVWLILFLAPRAAASLPADSVATGSAPRRTTRAVVAVGIALGLLGSGLVLARRGDAVHAPGADVVAQVHRVAAGRPVLASEPLAETLAQAGVRVWACNPIDAFPTTVQADFLDFLHGGPPPASADVDVVVVAEDDAPATSAAGWREVGRAGGYVLFDGRPVGR